MLLPSWSPCWLDHLLEAWNRAKPSIPPLHYASETSTSELSLFLSLSLSFSLSLSLCLSFFLSIYIYISLSLSLKHSMSNRTMMLCCRVFRFSPQFHANSACRNEHPSSCPPQLFVNIWLFMIVFMKVSLRAHSQTQDVGFFADCSFPILIWECQTMRCS